MPTPSCLRGVSGLFFTEKKRIGPTASCSRRPHIPPCTSTLFPSTATLSLYYSSLAHPSSLLWSSRRKVLPLVCAARILIWQVAQDAGNAFLAG